MGRVIVIISAPIDTQVGGWARAALIGRANWAGKTWGWARAALIGRATWAGKT